MAVGDKLKAVTVTGHEAEVVYEVPFTVKVFAVGTRFGYLINSPFFGAMEHAESSMPLHPATFDTFPDAFKSAVKRIYEEIAGTGAE